MTEGTQRGERAILRESTKLADRAAYNESTRQGERVKVGESTKDTERVMTILTLEQVAKSYSKMVNELIIEVRATLEPGASKTITLQFFDCVPFDITIERPSAEDKPR